VAVHPHSGHATHPDNRPTTLRKNPVAAAENKKRTQIQRHNEVAKQICGVAKKIPCNQHATLTRIATYLHIATLIS
jgi:hypothetical protein